MKFSTGFYNNTL